MIQDELEALQQELSSASAEAILSRAAARFAPRLVFTTGFGVEGCVVIELIARHRLPIKVVTLDTGLLFPETLELWRKLEARYGLTIEPIRPRLDLQAQAAAHGEALWERDPDLCCELRKVRPLRQALSGHDAWVTAIRRDQTADRAAALPFERDARFGLIKVNPLVGWTAKDVWDHVHRHDVPYSPLHDRGFSSIGCAPCTTPVAKGEDPRAGRWRGRAKKECGLHRADAKPRPVAPGAIVWLTGLSGAGKSTLATALAPRLAEGRPVQILDGDEVRPHLSQGLGFSREDRDTNVRRIGYVARLLAKNGTTVIAAVISPYRAVREELRAQAEADGIAFVEVFADAPLQTLVERDVKGLYRRALAGQVPHFTGVSDPYEPPLAPEVVFHSDREPVEASVARVLAHLASRKALGAGEEAAA